MPMYVYDCSLRYYADDADPGLPLYSLPRSTYYDQHNRQAAALMRARQPYLIKNIITGVGLFTFTIGICQSLRLPSVLNPWSRSGGNSQANCALTSGIDYMTFKLVGQDDFEDVQPPALAANKPSQPPHAPHSSS